MSKYIPSNNRAITLEAYHKSTDQIVITGEDEEHLLRDGVFFIEFISVPEGESITIYDGKDNLVASNVTSFASDHSPIRCDYGVKITGNVSLFKGKPIHGVFVS